MAVGRITKQTIVGTINTTHKCDIISYCACVGYQYVHGACHVAHRCVTCDVVCDHMIIVRVGRSVCVCVCVCVCVFVYDMDRMHSPKQ